MTEKNGKISIDEQNGDVVTAVGIDSINDVGRLKDVRPVTETVGAQEYAVKVDGTLGEHIRELAPQWEKPTFFVQTLSGLAALAKNKVDDFPEDVCLHVFDHLTVRLISLKADDFGRRHFYASAVHRECAEFPFNKYIAAEDFLIQFRRSFLFNDEAVKVQKVCSQLESGMTVNLADDGISQSLEIKTSTASRAAVTLPAEGIPLIPWRTFRDANQVESKFLLRFKGDGGFPLVALFEIDQTWQLDCVNSIRKWLESNVKDIPIVA